MDQLHELHHLLSVRSVVLFQKLFQFSDSSSQILYFFVSASLKHT